MMPLFTPPENSENFFKCECSSDKLATWNEEGCFKGLCFPKYERLMMPLFTPPENSENSFKCECSSDKLATWNELGWGYFKGLCFPK